MAKATKPLGGAAKDKYLRELIGSVRLDADAARQLTETAKREITQVRVRLPLPERTAAKSTPATAPRREAAPPAASAPPAADTETAPAAPVAPPAAPAADAAGQSFDPFAFSATVVLKRKGKAELARLLDGVTEPAHLKLIAEKQHLGLPANAATAAELRSAIIEAAAARIDERRAAAS